MHYHNKETIALPAKITIMTDDKNEIKVPNLDYTIRVALDQHVLSYLLNSHTKEILGHVTTNVMTASAWSALEELYACQSRAKVTNLRFALTNTKKGTMTMSQYFTKMKGFANELAAYGKILDDEEVVLYSQWSGLRLYTSFVFYYVSLRSHIC
jgi:hypothetical protein